LPTDTGGIEESAGSSQTEEVAPLPEETAEDAEESEEDASMVGLVNDRLKEAMNSEAYSSADIPGRAEIIVSLLEELKELGAVQEFFFDGSSDVVSFTYCDGTLGGALLKEFDKDKN
jgi:hypothetical protein